MNRQERRARMKKMRMSVLRGGKKPDAPQVDASQPAGALAIRLDSFIQSQCMARPDFKPVVLPVLLQMLAGLIVEQDAPETEVYMALETFVARERAARQPSPEPVG